MKTRGKTKDCFMREMIQRKYIRQTQNFTSTTSTRNDAVKKYYNWGCIFRSSILMKNPSKFDPGSSKNIKAQENNREI